ncbi:MAG: undecaprenyl-diphosphate phosphatase [Deltaproteobacteria bacterium]|nr:undecaprenyl-diphosphate phosphatase [Deltaproteobacteria bacterium]
MSLFQAAILGIVQGFTEFLPISSSGHLVLFQKFFGFTNPKEVLAFDVALHLGTLLSVVAIYWKDLGRMVLGVFGKDRTGRRLVLLLVVATLPAVAVGLLFKGTIERLFAASSTLPFEFLFTGFVLWGTRYLARYEKGTPPKGEGEVSSRDAFWVGWAQALAIIPAVSRSGMTVAAALFLRFDQRFAARFSFLMAIPAILGAGLLEAREMAHFDSSLILPVVVGSLVSAVSGFLAIRWLIGVISRGRLHFFAYYCWAVGIFSFFFL